MESGRRIVRKIVYITKADDRGIYCCKHSLTDKKKKKNLILCVDVMFTAFLAQNIGNYQARFERFIKGLKIDGFEVLGYARKSPRNLTNEALKKNLKI